MAKYSNEVVYNIKTTLDKAGVNKLQSELTRVAKTLSQLNSTPNKMKSLGLNAAEVTKYEAEVKKLQSVISQTFNARTGMMDLNKFNSALKTGAINVTDLNNAFVKTGSLGKTAFNSLITTMTNVNKSAITTSSALSKIATTFGNTVRWGITASIFQSMMGSVSGAVSYMKDLDESLTQIQMVSQASAENMRDLAQYANKAAQSLATTTVDYTNAIKVFTQEGFSLPESKLQAELSVKLANVSEQDTATTADQITAYRNAFGLSIDQMSQSLDKLANVANNTAANVGELMTAAQRSASVASSVGATEDSFIASVATIQSVTRQSAEEIGNGLKTIMQRFADIKAGNSTEDGADYGQYAQALKTVGVDVLDQNGEFKGFTQIISELQEVWSGLSDTMKVAVGEKVAGKFQYNRFAALMNNPEYYQKAMGATQNADGMMDQMQDTYADSIEGRMKTLQAAGEQLMSSLFNQDTVEPILEDITSVVNALNTMVETVDGGLPVLTSLSAILLKTFSPQISAQIGQMATNIMALSQGSANQKIMNEALMNAGAIGKGIDSKTYDTAKKTSFAATGLDQNAQQKVTSLTQQMAAAEEETLQATKERDLYLAHIGDKLKELMAGDSAIKADIEQIVAASKEELMTSEQIAEKLKLIPGYEALSASEQEKHAQNILRVNAALEQEKALQEAVNAEVQAMRTQQIVQGFTQSLSALTNIGFALMSINSFMDTWTSETATLGEKFQALLITLPMIATSTGMAVSSFKGAGDALRIGLGVETVASKTVIDNTAVITKTAETEATEVLIKAEERLRLAKINTATATRAAEMASNAENASLTKSILSTMEKAKADEAEAAEALRVAKANARKAASEVADAEATAASTTSSLAAGFIKTANTSGTFINKLASIGPFAEKAAAGTLTFGGALAAVAGPILTAAAAIGLLVAGIVKLYEVYNADSIAAEKAESQAKELTTAYNDLKKSNEELKSSFSKYDEAKSALEDMTEGTAEWNEQLQKTNDEVLSLIEKYPELAKYVSRASDGSLYVDNTDREAFIEEQDKALASAKSASILANVNANQARAQSNKTDLGRSITYFDAQNYSGYGAMLPSSVSNSQLDTLYKMIEKGGEVGNAQDVANALGVNVSDPIVNAIVSASSDIVKGYNKEKNTNKANEIELTESALQELQGRSDFTATGEEANAIAKEVGKQISPTSRAYQDQLEKIQSGNDKSTAKEFVEAVGGEFKNFEADYFHPGESKITYTDAQGTEHTIELEAAEKFLTSSNLMSSAADKWQEVASMLSNIANSDFAKNTSKDFAQEQLTNFENGKKELDLSSMYRDDMRKYQEMSDDEFQKATSAESLGINDADARREGYSDTIDDSGEVIATAAENMATAFSEALRASLEEDKYLDYSDNSEQYSAKIDKDTNGGAVSGESNVYQSRGFTDEAADSARSVQELDALFSKAVISSDAYQKALQKISSSYAGLADESQEVEKAQEDLIKAEKEFGKNSEQAKKATQKLTKAQEDLGDAVYRADWTKAAKKCKDYVNTLNDAEASENDIAEASNSIAKELTELSGIKVDSSWVEENASLLQDWVDGVEGAGSQVRAQLGMETDTVKNFIAEAGQAGQDIVSAVDGLQFDVNGNADFTPILAAFSQVMESEELTEQEAANLANLLASVGATHLDFEQNGEAVHLDIQSIVGRLQEGDVSAVADLQKAVAAFQGSANISGTVPANSTPQMAPAGGGGGGSGSGGGGGGSGSGGKAKKKRTEEAKKNERDPFIEIKNAIERQNAVLEKQDELNDELYGKDKIKNLDKVIKSHEKLADLYKQEAEIQKQQLEMQRNQNEDEYGNKTVKGYAAEVGMTVQYNDDGDIINGKEIQKAIWDRYKAAYDIETEHSDEDDYSEYTEETKKWEEILSGWKDAESEYGDALDNLDNIYKDIRNEIDEIQKANDEQVDTLHDLLDEWRDIAKEQREMNQTMQEFTNGADIDKIFEPAIEAGKKTFEDILDWNGTGTTVNGKTEELSLTRTQAQEYFDKINSVTEEKFEKYNSSLDPYSYKTSINDFMFDPNDRSTVEWRKNYYEPDDPDSYWTFTGPREGDTRFADYGEAKAAYQKALESGSEEEIKSTFQSLKDIMKKYSEENTLGDDWRNDITEQLYKYEQEVLKDRAKDYDERIEAYTKSVIGENGYKEMTGTSQWQAALEGINNRLADAQEVFGNPKDDEALDSYNKFTQDQSYTNLKDAISTASDVLDQLYEAVEKEEEVISDGLDKIADKIDRGIEIFDNILDDLDSYSSINDLVYGESAQGLTNRISIDETSINALASKLSLVQAGEEQYKQILAPYEQLAEANDMTLEQLKASNKISEAELEAIQIAQDNITDLQQQEKEIVADQLEKITDSLETSATAAAKNLVKETLGTDSDWMQEQWEMRQRNEELYYDDMNRAYQLQKLQYSYQKMLNDASNSNALIQQQITEHMNDQLEYLRNKEKLSEVDINYANARLAILEKEIALQDAQDAKTQMRLQRDASGNYSYVYTANEDDVAQKQQDLLDAQINAYNIAKDGLLQAEQDTISQVAALEDQLISIITDASLNTEEREARIAEVIDSANEYVVARTDQIKNYSLDTLQAVSYSLGTMSENTGETLNTIYNSLEKDLMKSLTSIDDRFALFAERTNQKIGSAKVDAESLGQKMSEVAIGVGTSTIGTLDTFQARTEKFQTETKTSIEKFETSTKTALGKIDIAFGATTTEANNLSGKITELNDKVDALNTDENSELNILRDRIDSVTEAVKDAINALHGENGMRDALKEVQAQFEEVYKKAMNWLEDINRKAQSTTTAISSIANPNSGEAVNDKPEKTYTSSNNNSTQTASEPDPPSTNVGDWVDVKSGTKWYADSWGGGSWGWAKGGYIKYRNNNSYGINIGGSGWIRLQDVVGYASGGYTGTWSDKGVDDKDGKYAVLHQKELVLNATDTENLLDIIKQVRQMQDINLSQVFDLTKLGAKVSGDTIEQRVEITAEFPDVTSSQEIETALLNLADMAYQSAHRDY